MSKSFKKYFILVLFLSSAFGSFSFSNTCEFYLNSTNTFVHVPKDSRLTLKRLVGDEAFENDLFFVFSSNTVYVVYNGYRFHGGSLFEFKKSNVKNLFEMPLDRDLIVVQIPSQQLKPHSKPESVELIMKFNSKYFLTCAQAACALSEELMEANLNKKKPYELLDNLVMLPFSKKIYKIGRYSLADFRDVMIEENAMFHSQIYFKLFLSGMVPLFFYTLIFN